MPVHVGEMSSEVSVTDGDLPLSPEQLEKLLAVILQRLEQRDRDRRENHEATSLRPRATPPPKVGR